MAKGQTSIGSMTHWWPHRRLSRRHWNRTACLVCAPRFEKRVPVRDLSHIAGAALLGCSSPARNWIARASSAGSGEFFAKALMPGALQGSSTALWPDVGGGGLTCLPNSQCSRKECGPEVLRWRYSMLDRPKSSGGWKESVSMTGCGGAAPTFQLRTSGSFGRAAMEQSGSHGAD